MSVLSDTPAITPAVSQRPHAKRRRPRRFLSCRVTVNRSVERDPMGLPSCTVYVVDTPSAPLSSNMFALRWRHLMQGLQPLRLVCFDLDMFDFLSPGTRLLSPIFLTE